MKIPCRLFTESAVMTAVSRIPATRPQSSDRRSSWDFRMRSARIAVLAALACGIMPAAAQSIYPSRPITVIVPYPAGGAADTVARIIAEPMRVSLRQPIIIENVSGANGTIAVGRVARAAPDGYTLSLGHWNTHVANGVAYRLDYDCEEERAGE
jgi:tripartite-type tricarboxylate transporter receptor subunit TctC